MTAGLKARIDELTPPAPKVRTVTARELLYALLECADLECFMRDGRARIVLELDPELLDLLAEFEAGERENDEDLEAAEVSR